MAAGSTTAVRELTVRVVILGIVLSVVMAAANVYLGLKAGMTVSASIPAAVVAMLILKGLFQNGTILEANQVQTGASAGESLAAGIIFTMPALVLIGAWQDFDFLTTTLIAFTGGLLGILLMIPMRRVFVVDNDELPYPEGVACAAVLETGDKTEGTGRAEAMGVVSGAGIGGAFSLVGSFLGLLKSSLEVATTAGSRVLFFGSDVSPALIGVGYIVRLNVAALVFIGGALAWWVCIPLLPTINDVLQSIGTSIGVEHLGAPVAIKATAAEQAWEIWDTRIRYIGVGAMVVGGIVSIVRVRKGLVRAVVELRRRFNQKDDESDPGQLDLPSKAISGFSVLTIVLIGGIYYSFTGGVGITILSTVVMIVMAFFFVAVASYIVGLVGNSNSPVSGMTITAVLFTGGMLFIFGFSGEEGMLATLGVAAIVCCAACTSGDVCNDLKTGALVGATPRKQQIMQIIGVAVASLVMAPILQALDARYTIGSEELSAPQAGLFASLAKGFFGDEQLPWGMVGVGVVLGILIEIVDVYLAKRKSKFRAHLMPVAVGMYLPFGLSVPILIGGILAHIHGRGARDEDDLDRRMHTGVLFSSGIIAGESLMGVLTAILFTVGLSVEGIEYGTAEELVTLAVGIGLVVVFYLMTKPKPAPDIRG